MKLLKQLGIILLIGFVAELLYYFIPLPIPASVYGLLILFLLLCLKVIKVEQVEDISNVFIPIMPIFFVPPCASIITAFVGVENQIIPLVITCVISTIVVVFATSSCAQILSRWKEKRMERDAK